MFENMSKERNYIFLHKSDLRHYDAGVFAARCVDERFHEAFDGFMRELGLGYRDWDHKSPAGGVKVFASPEKESDTDYMLRELAISIKAHKVNRVMLFNHHDCAAYGGFGKFGNDDDKELEFHKEELARAQKVILERFPALKVETYFIDKKGIIKIS